MRGLVLDFDGVVFNSAPEAYLVSRRAYADTGPVLPPLIPLPSPGRIEETSLEDVRADPVFTSFLERIPLGNRAEDYAVILSTIERGVDLKDQAAYDRERAQLEPGYAQAYHSRFYRVRGAFQDQHPERWRALQGPYPEFAALLKRRCEDVVLAIATAKDRRSVRLLLEQHGLGDLVPDERLMDKETGPSKEAHLRHLQSALGVPFPELTFVEDKVNHLDAVAPLGVRCVLASWGYNGRRELDLARERGYIVCGLDDAEATLFGDHPEGGSTP